MSYKNSEQILSSLDDGVLMKLGFSVMRNRTSESKLRSSTVGHFFSRIGSTKHRSKSSRDRSLNLSNDSITPCITQPASPNSTFKNVSFQEYGCNTQRNCGNTINISYSKKFINHRKSQTSFFLIYMLLIYCILEICRF